MSRVACGDLEWQGEEFWADTLKARIACRKFAGIFSGIEPRVRMGYREDDPTTPHDATISVTDKHGDRLCYVIWND